MPVSTVPQAGLTSPLTAATAQTASGSSVDFTGIPSWVKRITVTMTDVSFAAAGVSRIRLGTSSGLVSSGYVTQATSITTAPLVSIVSVTDGLASINTGAADRVNAVCDPVPLN